MEQIKSHKTLIKNRIKNLIAITELSEQNTSDEEIIEIIESKSKSTSQNE
jgi:hypothetical protein